MGYRNASVITPSDSANLPGTIQGISCGVAGTVAVDTVAGSKNITLNLIAGFIYNVEITRVYNTGTSATGLNGYW